MENSRREDLKRSCVVGGILTVLVIGMMLIMLPAKAHAADRHGQEHGRDHGHHPGGRDFRSHGYDGYGYGRPGGYYYGPPPMQYYPPPSPAIDFVFPLHLR